MIYLQNINKQLGQKTILTKEWNSFSSKIESYNIRDTQKN